MVRVATAAAAAAAAKSSPETWGRSPDPSRLPVFYKHTRAHTSHPYIPFSSAQPDTHNLCVRVRVCVCLIISRVTRARASRSPAFFSATPSLEPLSPSTRTLRVCTHTYSVVRSGTDTKREKYVRLQEKYTKKTRISRELHHWLLRTIVSFGFDCSYDIKLATDALLCVNNTIA